MKTPELVQRLRAIQPAGFGSGKAILLGEHAAVYGVHALVASLSLDVHAEVRPSDRPGVRLRLFGAHIEPAIHSPDDGSLTGRALAALLGALPRLSGIDIWVRSSVPAGVGLGGSAALSVALARALATAAGVEADDDRLRALAATAESIFHGRPSGVDVAAAALTPPAVIAYRRGDPIEHIELGTDLDLVIAVIEAAPPTHEMVARVAAHAQGHPEPWKAWLAMLSELVARARQALEQGDCSVLAEAFEANHALLAELGLSTPALDGACRVARDAGALGAKLTGKGGGGAVLALAPGPRQAQAIDAAFRQAGARFTHQLRLTRPRAGEAP